MHTMHRIFSIVVHTLYVFEFPESYLQPHVRAKVYYVYLRFHRYIALNNVHGRAWITWFRTECMDETSTLKNNRAHELYQYKKTIFYLMCRLWSHGVNKTCFVNKLNKLLVWGYMLQVKILRIFHNNSISLINQCGWIMKYVFV